jgi:hypothetical protein
MSVKRVIPQMRKSFTQSEVQTEYLRPAEWPFIYPAQIVRGTEVFVKTRLGAIFRKDSQCLEVTFRPTI